MKFGPIFILIGLNFIALSCKYNSPESVIDQNKMAEIFFDISLAEGYTESYLMKDSLVKKDSMLQSEIDKVLKIHKVDTRKFTLSYNYYRKNPSEFKVLLDSANKRAMRNREALYNRRPINAF